MESIRSHIDVKQVEISVVTGLRSKASGEGVGGCEDGAGARGVNWFALGP